jgi:hypothetical protein
MDLGRAAWAMIAPEVKRGGAPASGCRTLLLRRADELDELLTPIADGAVGQVFFEVGEHVHGRLSLIAVAV